MLELIAGTGQFHAHPCANTAGEFLMTKSDFELMVLALSSVSFAPDLDKSSVESEQAIAAKEETVAQPVVRREPGWGI